LKKIQRLNTGGSGNIGGAEYRIGKQEGE